ncbi:MAG TPA: TlpA disulfide reductase family protein [Polyangiaceae bacterium]|jgi:thiol-disulfide isomerase/thioredoxin
MARPADFARLTLCTLVAVAAGACGHPSFPPSAGHPLLGTPLPEIRHRQTLGGVPFDGRQLAGKPVLVKFFADYCRPCKDTLPAAERVHEDHPDVAFLGIDEDESAEIATDVARRFGLTFPVIHDGSNVLSGRFRVSSMPMTFVADGSGVIRWVGGEGQTEEDLRRAVEAAE